MNIRDYKTVKERRAAMGKLPHIGSFSLDEHTASTRNCENMIGIAQVPMGVAGPLKIGDKEYFVPLATTEGALVASINRGAKAITQGGGAQVHTQKTGATRGPVFKVKNLAQNTKLYEFLEHSFNEIKKITEATSQHLTLKKISSKGVGLYRYVRFVYDTQDAMGLNMVTIATDSAASYIEEQTGAECIALSGNFCVDKKPSWQNFLNNRGIKTWAEIVLSEEVLRTVLKTTAKKAYETWYAKCILGSIMSGSMGFNAQYANILAALFIATGQDPAHVSECSIGVTTCEVQGNDLYISIYLPDLMVGIIGGGTGLATQKEALGIIGAKSSTELAQVVGATVLAGEISLLSSLEQGTLASAHQKLARGK